MGFNSGFKGLIDHLWVYKNKSLSYFNDSDFNLKKHSEIDTGLMAMILFNRLEGDRVI